MSITQERKAELIKEFGNRFFIPHTRYCQTAKVQLTCRIIRLFSFFSECDDLFNKRAKRLSFRDCGFNSTMSEQGNRKVAHHGGSMRSGYSENVSAFTVAHEST